jgi:hypothetical protein
MFKFLLIPDKGDAAESEGEYRNPQGAMHVGKTHAIYILAGHESCETARPEIRMMANAYPDQIEVVVIDQKDRLAVGQEIVKRDALKGDR